MEHSTFHLAGEEPCGMNAFKAHCAFAIHGDGEGERGLGYIRIATLEELPPRDALAARLRAACARIAQNGSPYAATPRAPHLRRLSPRPSPRRSRCILRRRRTLPRSVLRRGASMCCGLPRLSEPKRAIAASLMLSNG